MLYVVIQTGIYRHDVVGVWDSLEGAKTGAEEAIAREKDDWHHMEVVETPLNGHGEDKVVAELHRTVKRILRKDGVLASEVEKQGWKMKE